MAFKSVGQASRLSMTRERFFARATEYWQEIQKRLVGIAGGAIRMSKVARGKISRIDDRRGRLPHYFFFGSYFSGRSFSP